MLDAEGPSSKGLRDGYTHIGVELFQTVKLFTLHVIWHAQSRRLIYVQKCATVKDEQIDKDVEGWRYEQKYKCNWCINESVCWWWWDWLMLWVYV